MRINIDHPLILAALAAIGLLAVAKGDQSLSTAEGVQAHVKSQPSQAHAAEAITPKPAPGVWPLAKRVVSETIDNDLMTQAAAITFYTLLSIFPGLTMLVSLFGLFADPVTIMHQVDSLNFVMPGGAIDLLREELNTLTSAGTSGLGWAAIIGLLTSLWTANQAMKAMFNGLNQVHEVKEKRSFIKLTLLTLLCTAGMVVLMIVALSAVIVVPAVLAFVGLGTMFDQALVLARWPLLLLGIAGMLAILFRFGPCRTKVVWRWITWGSGFASVMWLIVSFAFSYYVSNFGNYNKTYGSLGAVVGFMTWMWISGMVILIGAQVDAELVKTTVGKQRSRRSDDEAPVVLPAS
ncbi:MAG: YihY/virulence factor BrkB family protein [Alphaproteobacteria bacterium]|nr:MAG: YihY/virulence factor BrkB family protein [Alphaproteobacteria bacterium]